VSLDLVLPFEVKPLGIRGRVVRLGPVIDDILSKHDYPAPVSALLAQAVALAALLGSTLKFEGKFILQTKTDGPVNMLVADFVSPNGIRGVARYAKAGVAAIGDAPTETQLLGEGYLAMTVDQGAEMERYQGIVPLGKDSLADAAHTYFAQSEQIPTRLHLAAGPLQMRGDKSAHWRAGAILIQHLPREGGVSPVAFSSGDAPEGTENAIVENDDWVKARMLLDTVESHELLDPTLSAEELLYRLYHEDGVTVYPVTELVRHCTCSRETVETMLRGFRDEDRTAMIEDGAIKVVCEFCSTPYVFKPAEFAAAPEAAPTTGPS
jgi:molecular chaperone Hsp33